MNKISELIDAIKSFEVKYGDRKTSLMMVKIREAIIERLNVKVSQRRNSEGRTVFFVLNTKDNNDVKTIVDFVFDYPLGYSCSCSHDCCGHWQYSQVYAEVGKYKTLVTQYSYPNI